MTQTTTKLPLASCIIAIVSVATLPLFNIFLSIGLAVVAFVLGIAGMVVARRTPLNHPLRRCRRGHRPRWGGPPVPGSRGVLVVECGDGNPL